MAEMEMALDVPILEDKELDARRESLDTKVFVPNYPGTRYLTIHTEQTYLRVTLATWVNSYNNNNI